MAAIQLTRTHKILIGVVVTGAVIIAGIGFAGSYAAVRTLAEKKGFGDFSLVFPIGIDAGICVLLALDLLLTWIRIPFPLLRQTAWLLTAATIAFNGAAAWPDPLGTAMHAVIPVLFVISVEAARHAIGRIADITADKHMEGVRITRWLLSPLPTFLLWRRMKLWELRSYEQVIKLEQERLVYQARLRSRFGRAWRRKAPVEALMPLRLARYGVPLAETAPAGLAAAGIEPSVLPPAAPSATVHRAAEAAPAELEAAPARAAEAARVPDAAGVPEAAEAAAPAEPQARAHPEPEERPAPEAVPQQRQADPQPEEVPANHDSAWFKTRTPVPPPSDPAAPYETQQFPVIQVPAPATGPQYANGSPYGPAPYAHTPAEPVAGPAEPVGPAADPGARALGDRATQPEYAPEPLPDPVPERINGLPEDVTRDEAYYGAFRKYVNERGEYPNARQFGIYLQDLYGVKGKSGGPLTENTLRPYIHAFRGRHTEELDASQEYA
ncbi:DUF2637 domain-containing protein [Streptomyces sp. NPDC060194]|uniref:DUF2637 domain-containing protein n=1 Tax=Streptomyces sp. NPDC060194 TaxID=3347069 RepID=UPI003647D17C